MAESCFYKKAFSWIRAKREKLFKCDLCSLNFVFQKDMLDHFVSNHKTNTSYGCPFCEINSVDSDFLLMHMQAHHLAFIYLCIKCDFQCKSEHKMLQHANLHANKMSEEQCTPLSAKNFIERRCLSCGICSRIFSQPSLLRRHTALHHSGGSNECHNDNRDENEVEIIELNEALVSCNDTFASVDCPQRHLKVEFQIDVRNHENSSSCDESHGVYENLNGREVIASMSSYERSPHAIHFFCIFCLKRFRYRHLLKSHERIHSKDIDPQERLEMLCEFCNKPFKGIENLRLHDERCNRRNVPNVESFDSCQKFPREKDSMERDGEDLLRNVRAQALIGPSDSSDDFGDASSRVRSSKVCDEKFWSDNKRRRLDTRGASSYVCHYCWKGFRSKIKFLDHYFEHDKTIKSFSCAACDARFGYSSSMPKHIEMHQRDLGLLSPKPPMNLCPKCGKHYRDRASLKRHEAMVHLKVGHPCHECQKTFSSNQALRQHARQHSGEFIYQCDLCPKKYANPSSLHNHKKTHSENKLACSLCSKSFALKHHLARHLARHVGFS